MVPGVGVGESSRGSVEEIPVVQQFLLLVLNQALVSLIEPVQSEQNIVMNLKTSQTPHLLLAESKGVLMWSSAL